MNKRHRRRKAIATMICKAISAYCCRENAKALSGIYGFVPLSDEPKPKKKQESNLEDCLNCEFLGLDELWSEFYCKKSDTRIHEDDDLVSEEKCKYFRRK